MPFALTNAPAVFQALVNNVLMDMLNQFIFVYLDDILIFSRDPESHKCVHQALQRLLQHHLYVKAEKCKFHAKTVSFLGFIISEGEVSMDLDKVCAVKDWPTPITRKQLQRFMGFLFIKNFSLIVAPLHALTSQKTCFVWTCQAQQAFLSLKQRFISSPVLSLPNPELQFVV